MHMLMDRARGLNLSNYRIQVYYLRRALVSGAQDKRIYINIGVYKYIKIHVTLIMSIYQNSNIYIPKTS